MQQLLEDITTQITGSSDIKITESETEGTITYTISAPKEFMGLLIGKEGKTIRAIRSLSRARAVIDGVNVYVQLADEDQPANQ